MVILSSFFLLILFFISNSLFSFVLKWSKSKEKKDMKNITLLVFIALTNITFVYPQNSIHTDNPVSSKSLSQHYFIIGKVWGFLKYHHPAFVRNKVNPDLFLVKKILPFIDKSTNKEQRANLLIKTIDFLNKESPLPKTPQEGKLKKIKKLGLDFYRKVDNLWITKIIESRELKQKLIRVYKRHPFEKSAFVNINKQIGVPNFDVDSRYFNDRKSIKNKNIRLLGLFRFWNIINYFFPSTYLMHKNWDQVLLRFIGPFLNAHDELSYNKECLKINRYLDDTHGYMTVPRMDDIRGNRMISLQLSYVDKKAVLLQNLSKSSSIPRGSVILEINGKNINLLKKKFRKYIAASNKSALHRDLNTWILYSKERSAIIKYAFKGKTRNIKVPTLTQATYYTRLNKLGEEKEKWKILDSNIGYIDMGILEVSDISKMFKDLWNTDGLILDIRNYPKGTVWNMINYLYPQPTKTHFFTRVDPRFPGVVIKDPPMALSPHLDYSKTYTKRIILLFNETSQSHAEYTIMAFEKARNAIKVGSQTAGADGNVVRIYLPGGVSTLFSSLGVYYPNGQKTQRIGIKPDVKVLPTIKSLQNGRDLLMERAVDLILRKK